MERPIRKKRPITKTEESFEGRNLRALGNEKVSQEPWGEIRRKGSQTLCAEPSRNKATFFERSWQMFRAKKGASGLVYAERYESSSEAALRLEVYVDRNLVIKAAMLSERRRGGVEVLER